MGHSLAMVGEQTQRAKEASEGLKSLETFFDREVIRGERIVAWTRLALASAGLLHITLVGRFPGMVGATADSRLTTTGMFIAGLYSAWTLATLRHASRRTELRLMGSVVVDVILIFMVTSGDLFSPDPNYLGILREPSVSLFLLAAVAAGVRLSRRVAVAGAIVMALVVAGMVIADMHYRADFVAYSIDEVVLGLILLLGATLLGYNGAARTRNLVFRGARFAVQAERTRQRFGVYVSEEVVEQVLRDGSLARSGRRQPVAVLFCDLRGFTAYAEKTAPEHLVAELNAYLDAMLTVVRAEGGWLDKYIGDALMVVFGIGEPRADDAARAIRTAAGMRTALTTHNDARAKKGKSPFAHGIGVHYGTAIVGNIGTSERLQFTVVGDVVNLASRLEATTKRLGVPVLISSVAAHVATGAGAEQAGILPALKDLGPHEIPGRTAAIDLVTLVEA